MSVFDTDVGQLTDEIAATQKAIETAHLNADQEIERIGRDELEKHNYAELVVWLVNPITGRDEEWSSFTLKTMYETFEHNIHEMVDWMILKSLPDLGRPTSTVKKVLLRNVGDWHKP